MPRKALPPPLVIKMDEIVQRLIINAGDPVEFAKEIRSKPYKSGPLTVYHLTPSRNLDSIKRVGLKAGLPPISEAFEGLPTIGVLFFSESLRSIGAYKHELWRNRTHNLDEIIPRYWSLIEVNLPEGVFLLKDPFTEMLTRSWITIFDVAPAYLKVLGHYDFLTIREPSMILGDPPPGFQGQDAEMFD